MDRDEAQLPAGGLHGDRDLQPRAVTKADVAEFESTEAARRLARLEADAELMLRISTEGFSGRTWRQLERALIDYGFQVMRAWTVTGLVFTKLKEKKIGVQAPPRGQIPRHDAIELAYDTVGFAIVGFRDRVLKVGRWNPGKGANLSTYFIGNCLRLQFPNLYRRWLDQQEPVTRFDPTDRSHPMTQLRARDNPSAHVIDNEDARLLLESIGNPTTRLIWQLMVENYDIDEIAELVGLSYGSVRSRIYRLRQGMKQEGATSDD